MNFKFSKSEGFTLIETLIAIAIFAIVSAGIYSAYSNVLDITIASQVNQTALTVMANELETIRNIKYSNIGIQGGSPIGIIPASKNINFSGFSFILNTTIRNIDDSFDGVLGGIPNDTAPADYKLVELELLCTNCPRFIPIKTTTTVAPVNLESVSVNGNIFINAIDASGQPISQANVAVVNNVANPPIVISDVTNNNGQLQLVDIATSSLGYQIAVTKSGYSTDKTYQPGDVQNPNPVKPHATVASQQVTIVSFAIDRLSAQTLKTRDKFCQPVSNIDFNQQGIKLIGTGPDVLKYSVGGQTDSSGIKTDNLEWDTYSIQNTDSLFDLAGTSLIAPFFVNPDSDYNINWLMEPVNGLSLLTTVMASGSIMLDEAVISLSKTGFNETKIAGHNYFGQTNWSVGNFSQKSNNVDELNPVGDLHIIQVGGKYASMSQEWLESQTFDLGTTANFYKLTWNPATQPLEAGLDSLKFQLATNNDNAIWNYIGPDGTAGTYYALSNTSINSVHNGSRYVRYKVYLKTENHDFTPSLEDITVEFSSACIPAAQAFFSGLTTGTYTLTIQKTGYQDYSVPITINSGWQEYKAILIP